ncbi:MAG TPA: Holliday junction branch migration DNA helicase RuvB [Armatimonadota bacterium]|jgi:Holliday junction DNA helicase RuvB
MDDTPKRERIISAGQQEEDQDELLSLRPRTLAEYNVGQDRLIQQLQIALQAAQSRGECLEHLLFDGPPGLGKTTLAYIIAQEMGAEMHRTSGPAMERAADLVGMLTNLKAGDVLFIDEIHRIPRVVEEYLYTAMEDFQIDFVVDRGPYAKTISLRLEPFTLIGATTRSGMLTAPLRERFGIFHHLDFYAPEQLQQIVQRSSGILQIPLEPAGAEELARRSRGTPRIVNRLLRRVRDYAQVVAQGVITLEVAHLALDQMGVDARGLDPLDRKYLRAMIEYYGGGPVGLNALSATLSEDADTLQDVVEPFLLKIGFVIRTARGRMATQAAYDHLAIKAPAPSAPGGQENLPLGE